MYIISKKTPCRSKVFLKIPVFVGKILLTGIVFHHELFLELNRNLTTERSRYEFAFHFVLIHSQIFRSCRRIVDGFLDLDVVFGTFADGDHVAGLYESARRIAADAIYGEMAVGNILACGKNGARKTHAEDEGVQAGFEKNHQVVACRTVTTVGFGISLCHLGFGNVVGEAETLLFDKLLLVNGSGLLAVLAVLTGTELTTVQNLLGFRGDCKPERAGNLGFGSTIGHCYLERKLFS